MNPISLIRWLFSLIVLISSLNVGLASTERGNINNDIKGGVVLSQAILNSDLDNVSPQSAQDRDVILDFPMGGGI